MTWADLDLIIRSDTYTKQHTDVRTPYGIVLSAVLCLPPFSWTSVVQLELLTPQPAGHTWYEAPPL